jgi:uncharacterized protein
MANLEQKHSALKKIIESCGSVIVAYSGGVDSALVLRVAHEVLGFKTLAVTADSPSAPRREIAEAIRIAQTIGARHEIIRSGEFQNPNYTANPANRCYFCKTELYSKLTQIAKREGIRYLANGANLDDLSDYRPGLQAALEYQVISPLREAGLTKAEVRRLAQQLGLEIWDKPASPCLSSRIPYGSEVTPEKLATIEAAENYLRSFDIRELRVRHFGGKARIETNPRDFHIVQQSFRVIGEKFKQLGFEEIELAEFRSGALNEKLKPV